MEETQSSILGKQMEETQSSILEKLITIISMANRELGYQKYNVHDVTRASEEEIISLIYSLELVFIDNPELKKRLQNYRQIISNLQKKDINRNYKDNEIER